MQVTRLGLAEEDNWKRGAARTSTFASGYFVEIRLGWESLEANDPPSYNSYGLGLVVNDSDTPGREALECAISPSPGLQARDPSTWATLVLQHPTTPWPEDAELDACEAARENGDYENAVRVCSAGVGIRDPILRSLVYKWLGFAYDQLGENDKAIAAYTGALSLNPNETTSLLSRGLLYARAGQCEEAVPDLERYIALPHATAFFINQIPLAERKIQECSP